MYQKQYWAEMLELRAHQHYLEFYQINSEKWEMSIKIFLAVMSSASIGAWAVWKNYDFLWAGLIAASQVISAIYPFLPFKSRIKPLSGAAVDLCVLADCAERDWYKVSEGLLSEEEINERRHKLKERKSKIINKHFGALIIPCNEKIREKAKVVTAQYFKNYS